MPLSSRPRPSPGLKPSAYASQTARTQDVLLRQTPQERRAAYSAAVVDLDEEES